MQNIFTQSKFEVRFIEVSPEWKAFQQFPMDTMLVDHADHCDFKVQQMVYMLNEAYQRTKKELANFFTVQEAWLIIGSFVSTAYSSTLSDKELLIRNIQGAIKFEFFDDQFDVDEKVLFDKLSQLTEFQAFTVWRMAYEYLYSPEKVEHELANRADELVKRIFCIEEFGTPR